MKVTIIADRLRHHVFGGFHVLGHVLVRVRGGRAQAERGRAAAGDQRRAAGMDGG